MHTDNAKQLFKEKEFEWALLEIKIANELLWDKENIKLEIILLLELDFFIEAGELYYKFINKFPALQNEIDFEKYYNR